MTKQKNGIVHTYHDTDSTKLQSKFFIFNGKKEGEYKLYHETGGLWYVFNYKNNNKEGIYTQYYLNIKQIYSIGNYQNDQYSGKFRMFWNNGILRSEYTYKNNKLEGEYLDYDKHEKLISTVKCII